jgi:amino acid adenylation domain-containing protein
VDVLLADAARNHADSVAVRGAGVSLTYREFDAAVNRLAWLLRSHGIRTGDRVAVVLPRSVDLPSVLAAVMRAGAAYVPIDPSNPADRVEYVLSHSGSSVVVVDESTRPSLENIDLADGVEIIELGTDSVTAALATLPEGSFDAAEQSRPIIGADAAYVIYTSGTTGRPKGVVVEHRGLLNFLIWKQRATGIESDDSVLQKTPISFDASVWEFFVPLMIGATVVMAEPDGHRDPAYLASAIAEEQLTTIEFVPSMLDALLEHGIGDTDTSSLRRIFCGGEAFSVATASAAVATFGDILYNLYGPTETTVGITSQEVGASLLASRDRFGAGLPIGVPAHNAQAWVLDHRLRLAPVGVAGELYLGGPQLARGYLGRPDLTTAAFIANPFGDDGERLYRTGDLVRWNCDGALEYLGRLDDQIKIRGFRVEVDEIRTVLEGHPAIRSAAVAARDRDGEKYLVAYYCMQAAAADTAAIERSLREHLASRLPEYMVPSAFCPLDAIPVTSNGKLDTKALPEPSRAVSEGGTEPSTAVEVKVAALVRDVLGLDEATPVMLEDNFFRLGGHSLVAARLVSRLNAALGSSLTMQAVFAGPTIGALAAACREAAVERTGSDALLLELKPAAAQASVFCVHASSGFGTVYGPLGEYVGHRGLIALQDPAHAGDPRDFESLDEVVATYTQAVLDAQPEGPYDLLGWSYGGHIAFGIARELERAGKRVATVTILDTPAVTPETIVRWSDPAALEAEVIRSFGMFAHLPDVAGLSRQELQARNRLSGGPLSNLGDTEAFAFMTSFERCLRLMEAEPTHGMIGARVLLVLGREHADSAGETAELWQRHVTDPLDVLVVDVDHEELVSADGASTWAPWWSSRLT